MSKEMKGNSPKEDTTAKSSSTTGYAEPDKAKKNKSTPVVTSEDKIYGTVPWISYSKKKVFMDLKNTKREFDSSVKSIDAFICGGVNYKKYKFTKTTALIEGDFTDLSHSVGFVCRSLVRMYDLNTNPTE